MKSVYPIPQRMLHFPLVVVLAVALATVPTGIARAGLVSTEEVIGQQDSAAERALVGDFLARQDVVRQMIEMGIDPAEAARRADSMTAGEARLVSRNIEALPAGQAKRGISVVLVLLLVILLILVI